MKYTYDCEFKEDGKTIDLISIGMVNMDTGAEFYAVSNEFNTRAVAKDDWLMENVMSSIEHWTMTSIDFKGGPLHRDLLVTDDAAMSRHDIAQGILDFIGDDRDVELWAWYCAYDHVAFAQLWGKMITMPDYLPFQTDDIVTLRKQAARKLGVKHLEMPQQPVGNHNALADARHNVVRYNYLMELLNDS